MLSNETAGLDEVAAAIGRSPEWLQRHWLSYHRRTGFPRRLPGAWVWPRKAVELWLATGGAAGRRPGEPVEPPANTNEASDPVALAAASLLNRYGAS